MENRVEDVKKEKFFFNPTEWVNPAHALDDGEWSDADLADIALLKKHYPELSNWGGLALGGAWGSFSSDVFQVGWCEWLVEKRVDLFLCYCCWIQTRGPWNKLDGLDEGKLLTANEWKAV